MVAERFFDDNREYMPTYDKPKTSCSAWGYYTSALAGYAPKNYNIETIHEWALSRWWAKNMSKNRLYEYCADIAGILDTWWKC